MTQRVSICHKITNQPTNHLVRNFMEYYVKSIIYYYYVEGFRQKLAGTKTRWRDNDQFKSRKKKRSDTWLHKKKFCLLYNCVLISLLIGLKNWEMWRRIAKSLLTLTCRKKGGFANFETYVDPCLLPVNNWLTVPFFEKGGWYIWIIVGKKNLSHCTKNIKINVQCT